MNINIRCYAVSRQSVKEWQNVINRIDVLYIGTDCLCTSWQSRSCPCIVLCNTLTIPELTLNWSLPHTPENRPISAFMSGVSVCIFPRTYRSPLLILSCFLFAVCSYEHYWFPRKGYSVREAQPYTWTSYFTWCTLTEVHPVNFSV